MTAPAGPPDEMWCGSCRFWERVRQLDRESEGICSGTCQRYAPRPFLQRWGEDGTVLDGYATAEPRWPRTMTDEWCGEFVRRSA